MGEIAEMMLDGTLCAGCGEALEGEGEGFPRYCSEQCAKGCGVDLADDDEEFSIPPANSNPVRVRQSNEANRGINRTPKPFRCHCHKGFWTTRAMRQHQRDKHGPTKKTESPKPLTGN